MNIGFYCVLLYYNFINNSRQFKSKLQSFADEIPFYQSSETPNKSSIKGPVFLYEISRA